MAFGEALGRKHHRDCALCHDLKANEALINSVEKPTGFSKCNRNTSQRAARAASPGTAFCPAQTSPAKPTYIDAPVRHILQSPSNAPICRHLGAWSYRRIDKTTRRATWSAAKDRAPSRKEYECQLSSSNPQPKPRQSTSIWDPITLFLRLMGTSGTCLPRTAQSIPSRIST